jgi:hypothetical protein
VFGANKMFFVVFVFFCAYPSCGRRFLVRGRARENSRSRSDWAIMGEVLGVILRVPSDSRRRVASRRGKSRVASGPHCGNSFFVFFIPRWLNATTRWGSVWCEQNVFCCFRIFLCLPFVWQAVSRPRARSREFEISLRLGYNGRGARGNFKSS